MAILDSELIMLRSLIISDVDANGGKMDNTAVVSTGVPNNLWPNVFKAERTAGSTKYRKAFYKVANDDDETLYNPQIWLDIITPGEDRVTLFAGTQTDTQVGIGGSEDHYGCAPMLSDVTATSTTVTVTVEHADNLPLGADDIFRDTELIRITNKVDPDSGTGTEELLTIVGTPTNSGNDVTITFTPALANDYLVSEDTRVASVYEAADIVAAFDNWVETSAGTGIYDEGGGYFYVDAIGSIEETYTLTFTDATHFTIKDADLNTIISGDTATDCIPTNSDASDKPLFTIEAAGWSLTWATDDTIVFQTHPASVPLWQKRVVPAGSSSLAGNKTTCVMVGESI